MPPKPITMAIGMHMAMYSLSSTGTPETPYSVMHRRKTIERRMDSARILLFHDSVLSFGLYFHDDFLLSNTSPKRNAMPANRMTGIIIAGILTAGPIILSISGGT